MTKEKDKYTTGDGTEIRDNTDKQIVRLLPVNCTKKKARELTKILCEALNKQK